MRRLVQRLQAAAAETIDRRAAGLDGEAGHQADHASDIKSLFALLLRVAEHDVFDGRGIDAGALDERADDGHGEIVGADVAKDALLRVSAANRRAAAINYNGGFHVINRRSGHSLWRLSMRSFVGSKRLPSEA